MHLNMSVLRELASRLGIEIKDDQMTSMCWAEKRLIHLESEHADNPHVLAHELAHVVNGGRASWRYASQSHQGLALRCEENICDMVADELTGMRRQSPAWPPVSGRAAHYVTIKAQIVINLLRERVQQ